VTGLVIVMALVFVVPVDHEGLAVAEQIRDRCRHLGRRLHTDNEIEILAPGVGESMEAILQGVLDSGEAFTDFEVSFGPEAPLPQGRDELVVRGSFYPVFDQGLVGILGIIEDLTPTRR
jgi:hypothetical protein